MSLRVTRRFAMLSSLAAITAGCGDRMQRQVLSQIYDRITGKRAENPLNRQQIEQNPYAIIEVRVGSATFAVLALVRRNGSDLEWISADRVVLVTRAGRVVKTVGLPDDLLRTRFIGDDPVASGLHRVESGATARRLADFSAGDRFQRLIVSRFEPLGPSPIHIVGLDYPTTLVREYNTLEAEDWEFVNDYWIDPGTGQVWQSHQHISTEFEPLEIKVLKPPASGV